MRNKINSTLKEYTSGEIKQSIKNYAEILNDKKYWFSYRWTIDEFLHRGLENSWIVKLQNKTTLIGL